MFFPNSKEWARAILWLISVLKIGILYLKEFFPPSPIDDFPARGQIIFKFLEKVSRDHGYTPFKLLSLKKYLFYPFINSLHF